MGSNEYRSKSQISLFRRARRERRTLRNWQTVREEGLLLTPGFGFGSLKMKIRGAVSKVRIVKARKTPKYPRKLTKLPPITPPRDIPKLAPQAQAETAFPL